jgi:hypothetical protein
MLVLIIISFIGLICGVIVGKKLDFKDFSLDSNIQYNPVKVILSFLGIVIILSALRFFSKYYFNWFTSYIIEYASEVVFCLSFFSLGLLIILELLPTNNKQKKGELLAAIALITFCICFLFYYFQPVDKFLGKPKIVEEIVLQTTDYTCAPAAIATLVRKLNLDQNIFEADVVKLTKTKRFGTTLIGEIRAMKKLGLNPNYQVNLTVDDLVKINKPALLIVDVVVRNKKIPHAVALLSVNKKSKYLAIANPLYGLEKKSFNDLKGYWLGDAIFVNN